jgi:phosphomannomutase
MSDIKFGTDGWRGIIGDDFTYESVRTVASAAAEVFAEEVAGELAGKRLIVGYDMRFEADSFAAAVAERLAERGFDVLLSDRPIPTPGVCFAIAHDESAVGGLMLTASHNPSKWLGIKVRMADGGASPSSFTDRIEAQIEREGSPKASAKGQVIVTELVSGYAQGIRASLALFAPKQPIERHPLKVVIDPMYGAGQGLLADLMREQDVDVVEIHAQRNPGFGGL